MNSLARGALFTAVALLAAAALSAQETGDLNPAVLEVNGDPIYAAQISMIMQTLNASIPQGEQRPPLQEIAKMATQRAVEQKLLAQEARRLGVTIDEAHVTEILGQAEKRSGGRAGLEANLAKGGATYEQLAQIVRETNLVRALMEREVMSKIVVTEEDATKFYDDNQPLFSTPDQVRVRHIIFAAAEDADEATVEAARKNATSALERARTGEDFAELATELSEGPTASRGGDLGFFDRTAMVEPFAEAAFDLEPGEISDVVRTSYGFHVIRLEEKRPAGIRPLAEVRDRVVQVIKQQKAGAELSTLVEKLSETATVKELANAAGGAPASPAAP